MFLPDYRKNPSSISYFDILLFSAVDLAPTTSVLAIIPALAILHNFGHSKGFFAERIAENITLVSGYTPKNVASSFVVARNDTTSVINLEGTLGGVATTGEVILHSCLTHVMETVGDGQSNKEWSRAGNDGRLVRNEFGSSSHGSGNENSEGGNGSGSRGVGGSNVGGGGDDGNAGGGSAGGSDHRAPGGRHSSAAGSSKSTSRKHTGGTGGAPPPPPPPPPHAALAVDDGCPRGFPNHQDSFELFDWTTTVVGLAVLVSLGKWMLDRWKVQQIQSVDICPGIPPAVVQILPDTCFRPELASAYDPNSYSFLPRQELFYDCGCERVLDGVQFNISTKEAFEILNGAARPKFHQNGADIGCGKHAHTISTSALSRLDPIFPFIFSLVIYLVGYIHCLLGQRRGSPTKQHPGGTSDPGFDAQGDANVVPDSIICDMASQQAGSNTDSSGSGSPLDPSAAIFTPTQRVATPINLPKFHFIPVLNTRERHRTRRVHKDDRHGHCQIDHNGGSFSGLLSSKWVSGH